MLVNIEQPVPWGGEAVGRLGSFVAFIDFHVVNASTVTDFQGPARGHRMWTWEEMGTNHFCFQPARAISINNPKDLDISRVIRK